MSNDTLLEAAEGAPAQGHRSKLPELLPAIIRLRSKGYSYPQVYAFLVEQGVEVGMTVKSFQALASRMVSAVRREE